MKKKIEYFLVLTLIKISKILPIKANYYLFDKIGSFMFKVLKKRRNDAISNLRLIFNDLSEQEIEDLAKRNFKSIAITACECLLLLNKKIEVIDLIENIEEATKSIKQAFTDNKNGFIVIAAHFGNWEILPKFASKLGFSQLLISKKGNNELIEENITSLFRNDERVEIIDKEGATGKIIKRLRSGGVVGLLTDLKTSANMAIIPFLGKDAMTVKTVGTLYVKYQPKIVPLFAKRVASGKYEVIVKEFPEIKLSDDKEQDIIDIIKMCNDVYGEIIMENPEQWFWVHRRWKINV
ncbi:lipid A biosynthesis lauroyl acyltransferase [Campylobacter blaseri]|uniref:Acyltransferase n=1 Tax=Campylobacter blaseri TaxID=2042961 RepID=A0A2P8QZP8_9BACT|nr:acyltransferase [Campylobacter blaseri]PSM51726.1 acyltransferase [Campylobacter blaseri]PSM53517.1 acyltransferase [Campylobacter blaseri]QKF86325.1 lipid A biosynthesis lauroyl acyltransferase [Campylobacter blaseri]